MNVRILISRSCIAVLLAVSVVSGARAQGQPALSADDTIAELRRIIAEQQHAIKELTDRVAALEAAGRSTEAELDIPPAEIPGKQFERPSGGAAFMPDFAVIGNHGGRFLVPRGYEGRNRFELGEIEIALQQPLYTGMSFFATLAGASDAGFSVGVEEAYASLSRPFNAPVNSVIGKRRLQFGKLNATHPHTWRHVDTPAAVAALLGEEGMFGNGASFDYTLPTKGLFANLEIGLWRNDSAHVHVHEAETGDEEEHHHHTGVGIAGDMPVGRLWLSKAIGTGAEVELGASHAFGRTDNGDNVRLTGADLTLRSYPSAFSRLQLQIESVWHNRRDRAEGTGSHTRAGHYALLTYAPDKYYEYGVRYDNTRYPWPIAGREQSLSFVVTNRLTEATLVRLQLKAGDRTGDVFLPPAKGFKEVFLQFIWGAGSHKHPLQ